MYQLQNNSHKAHQYDKLQSARAHNFGFSTLCPVGIEKLNYPSLSFLANPICSLGDGRQTAGERVRREDTNGKPLSEAGLIGQAKSWRLNKAKTNSEIG